MKICSRLSGAVKMQIRLTFCTYKFEEKEKKVFGKNRQYKKTKCGSKMVSLGCGKNVSLSLISHLNDIL
jgi:hypothetical protein